MGKQNLLKAVEDFLEETGMSATYFGKVAGGGSGLVERLRRDSGDVLTATERRVREYMRSYRRRAQAAKAAGIKPKARPRQRRKRSNTRGEEQSDNTSSRG